MNKVRKRIKLFSHKTIVGLSFQRLQFKKVSALVTFHGWDKIRKPHSLKKERLIFGHGFRRGQSMADVFKVDMAWQKSRMGEAAHLTVARKQR